MPKLFAPAPELKRFYLPSTLKTENEDDRGWVDLDLGKLVSADIEMVRGESTEVQAMFQMLVRRIKGWNFTDVQDQPLPITYDTIKLLEMEDFTYLAEQLKAATGMSKENATAGLSIEEKKA